MSWLNVRQSLLGLEDHPKEVGKCKSNHTWEDSLVLLFIHPLLSICVRLLLTRNMPKMDKNYTINKLLHYSRKCMKSDSSHIVILSVFIFQSYNEKHQGFTVSYQPKEASVTNLFTDPSLHVEA